MLNQTGFSYAVFGLSVRSNLPIPGLAPVEIPARERDSSGPEIGIRLGARPQPSWSATGSDEEPYYVSSYLAPSGEPSLRIWSVAQGAAMRLSYFDGVQFWVDRRGDNIWAHWPAELSVEDAATYLLGPVLGLLLRLRGATCLHASAVSIHGETAAFVGSSGAGKSTTAAALARHGFPVVSDDIVALSDSGHGFDVLPSYPYLSLWPEPIDTLYGSADAAPRFTPAWEKRCLAADHHGVKFEKQAVPLKAIYILGERTDSPAAGVTPISAEAAFLSLVANTYATNILNREMRAREFQVLSQLIERVPVLQLTPPRDLNRLGELCRLIVDDFIPRASRRSPK